MKISTVIIDEYHRRNVEKEKTGGRTINRLIQTTKKGNRKWTGSECWTSETRLPGSAAAAQQPEVNGATGRERKSAEECETEVIPERV